MKKVALKTRHALIMSLISLMTCFAMLLGSTFAWFTDSVTSGVNRIVAGNLDVEVYHKTSGTGTDNPEEKVDGTTKLFTKDINGKDLLWEPEVMAYETFTVSNEGTLALKYQMALNNVGYNTLDGHSLLEVIKVAVAQGAAPANREAAQALFASGQTFYTLNDLLNGALPMPTGNDGHLAAKSDTSDDDTEEFAVVLYWPQSDADNNWNVQNGKTTSDGNPLFIDLGITLLATQDTVESDSFDMNYDASALYGTDSFASQRVSYAHTASADSAPQMIVAATETTLTAAATPASSSGNTTVTFEADALTAGSSAVLTVNTENVLAANAANDTFMVEANESSAVASIDLTLKVDGSEVNTFNDSKAATVNTYITKGLSSVVVKYNTDSMDNVAFKAGVTADVVTSDTKATVVGEAKYNPNTGFLSFRTDHFSKYVVYDNIEAYNATLDKVYTTLQGAVDEANSGNEIFLLKDVTNSSVILIGKNLTLNGNGHEIRNSANRVIRVTTANTDLKIYDCGIISTCTATSDVRGISFDGASAGSKLLLEGCTVSASFYAINAIPGADNLTVTIRNGTVAAGWAAINTYSNNSTYTITDSTLRGTNDKGESSWNNFNTITIDGNKLYTKSDIGSTGSGNTVNITNSTVYASSESSNTQYWLGLQYGALNNTVTVDGSSRIINASNEDMTDVLHVGWYCNYQDGSWTYYENGSNSVTVNGTALNFFKYVATSNPE